ncbi:uncharacterized protein LOC8258637 [Ricinus communis]|uniref:uncharacterized protein LOC8258637 n=1 Tax=Ricinus communis TaxID=3988 RepID=UPI00201A78BA|nr:uncharacterized protein LOC8258637 [Ricinus communis]
MRCFLACFNSSKHTKQRHLMNPAAGPAEDDLHKDGVNEVLQLDFTIAKQQVIEEPLIIIDPITIEPKEKLEEQLSNNEKKKVSFDLNARVYEALSAEEATNTILVQNNVKKESENKEEEEEASNESKSISNLISSNGTSYPPNHRYQNYTEEECEDIDLQDSHFDGGSEHMGSDSQFLVQEESSESLFSLSIDSRKQVYEAEVGEKEVTSPMPKCGSSREELKAIGSNQNAQFRNQNVDSVLNSVENLPQRKAIKARAILLPDHLDKENIDVEQNFGAHMSPEPSFKVLTNNSKADVDQKKLSGQEIAVDTSLSSWLGESATTPLSKGSANSIGNSPSQRTIPPKIHEAGPILGELTVKELEQVSVSTSPRRARSKTPESPVIGTIGSYWSHTGQTIDSDSGSSSSKGMSNTTKENGEDERRKWNCEPLEARLDRIVAQVLTRSDRVTAL